MGPAEQRTETPLQTGEARPKIQVPAQSIETPRPPERYGVKRSSRALAPGERPCIWPQSCGPQIGSEYAASESPALTFTNSQKRPPPSVVSLLIPNRPPVAPRNDTVSRATKNPRAQRTLRLALGLIANRPAVVPAMSTPKPVAPESSTCGSARARGHSVNRTSTSGNSAAGIGRPGVLLSPTR